MEATRSGIDLILTGGKIWTENPAQPQAEAVAISNRGIVQVGSSAETLQLRATGGGSGLHRDSHYTKRTQFRPGDGEQCRIYAGRQKRRRKFDPRRSSGSSE